MEMAVEEDLTFSKDELPEDVSLVIVDDDAPFLQRLSRAMEQRGFDVRTASSVSDGRKSPGLSSLFNSASLMRSMTRATTDSLRTGFFRD